jgi:putative Holliday junction resolvase
MAIDYGKSRVGVAISDPLGVISQPLLTLRVKSDRELIKRLKCIIEENSIGAVVVGNPLSSTGKSTNMSNEVKKFVKKLKKSLNIEIKLWDERFTSKYALHIMKDMGLKEPKYKIDQVAACIMLDEYLKSQSTCSA